MPCGIPRHAYGPWVGFLRLLECVIFIKWIILLQWIIIIVANADKRGAFPWQFISRVTQAHATALRSLSSEGFWNLLKWPILLLDRYLTLVCPFGLPVVSYLSLTPEPSFHIFPY